MIFYRSILIFLFQKNSFFTSVIIHSVLLIYVINFISYKPNLPLQNNKLIAVQLFNQSNKNREDINDEKKSFTPKKIVKPVITSKDLDSPNEKNNNNTNIKQSKNLIENKKKEDKKDNFISKEKQSRRESISKNPSLNNISKELSEETKSPLAPAVEENNYLELLEDYKSYLKNKIQKEASIYYPKISIRKREEGNVEIVFSLDKEGIIKEVTVGDNTNASKRIIDSLTKVLKNKIVKFEKNEILKKTNTFSIIIVYKLK
jgi:outer membrane biosynthesis protein TonB